jgi:hypothetical protein
MTTFEYRHDPTLSQEFVNGAYELGEVKQINIDGHDILYRVGSATLDNSCCGNFGCGYGLVIGESMGAKPHDNATPVSLVREITADEAIAETTKNLLMEREALGVVNFYTRTKDAT